MKVGGGGEVSLPLSLCEKSDLIFFGGTYHFICISTETIWHNTEIVFLSGEIKNNNLAVPEDIVLTAKFCVMAAERHPVVELLSVVSWLQ